MASHSHHSMSFPYGQQPTEVKDKKHYFLPPDEPSSSTGIPLVRNENKNEGKCYDGMVLSMDLITHLQNALVETNECQAGCSGEEAKLKEKYGTNSSFTHLGEPSHNHNPPFQMCERPPNFQYDDESEKIYPCKQCSKKFSQESSLMYHMKIHNGEKPYACTYCNKRFYQNAYLMKHIKVHGVDRPYECKVCPKKFSRSDSLQRHMRIHTGEKPCVCKICDEKFSFDSSLKWHMKKHERNRRHDVSTQCSLSE